MTTCIWGENILYTDSLVCDYYVRNIKKHRILENGNLVFGAGDLYTLHSVWDWLEDRTTVKPSINEEDDKFISIMVEKVGPIERKLYIFNRQLTLVEIPNELVVLGSGYEYVIGAIAAGASLESAIEIACRYDSASGGDVVCIPF